LFLTAFLRFQNTNKHWKWNFLFIASVISLLITFITSIIILYLSSQNYPGGYAFQKLHNIETGINLFLNFIVYHQIEKVEHYVHIDIAAAQSGVSRYGESLDPLWKYSKEENLTEFSKFTHLLSEHSNFTNFKVIGVENSFSHIQLSSFPMIFKFHPKIYILKNIKP
jgi:alpha-1,6-mannosyltransferase